MANPFEDDDRMYLVLVNDEGQYSLWPADIDVPSGLAAQHGALSRLECLSYIEEHWTDMRPASLARAMAGD